VADIGNLVFTPAQDDNGAGYDSFDFKVHDGTEYSAAANTITVDVTPVQDAPTAVDKTITTNEDIAYTFSAADFGFSDVDAGDSLTKLQITSLESNGTLKLSGVDVTLNQEILLADIGNLVFTPTLDANGTSYDTFDFKVHDGTEYSAADNTITVDVTPVQDAPTAADNTVTTNEDTGYTFSAADFGFSDVDAGDSLTKIQITSLESVGTLKLSGADVTLNQEILVADIGNLVFTPAPDANGASYDSFDFKVHDGTEYSVADNTITVDVTPVQDAPTAADKTVTTNEDTGYTFAAADFGFSDVDAGDSLTKIQITNLESAGTLKLSGADVTLNQEILVADIGNLVFTPAQDANGTSYDSFDFKVHDGTEYSAIANTITVDVTPVQDAPTAVNSGVTTNEDAVYTFSASDFNFADVDAGDSLTQIQISGLESAGSLKLNGVDVTLNQIVSVADINAGLLTFAPTADANGIGYDSFLFKVHDGTEFSALPYSMVVDVSAINDAPLVDAGPGQTVDASDIVNLAASASDVDGPSLSYTWTQISGPAVVLSDANVANPSFTAPQGLPTTDLVFQVEASDGSLTANDTVTITVNPDNLAPSVSAGDVLSAEGEVVTLVATATDPEGQNLTYQWTQVSGAPVTLYGTDTASAVFTAPLGLGNADLEFQVMVSDGTFTATDTMTVSLFPIDPTADPTSTEPLAEDTDDEAADAVEDTTTDPAENSTPATEPVEETVEEPPLPPAVTAEPESPPEQPAAESSPAALHEPRPELPTNEVGSETSEKNAATDPLNGRPLETLDGDEHGDPLESGRTADLLATGGVGQRVLPDSGAGELVALSASVVDELDTDTRVTWRQIAGTRVELSDDKAAAPSFTAPKLLVSEELVFEVQTVRDGKVVTETVSVVVDPVTTVKRPQGYALSDWDNEQDSGTTEFADGETAKPGLFNWLLGTLFSALRIGKADSRWR
ncbi:MAG: Ig-like domain-containing protein, partial [Planctomycetota bacterium]